MWSPLSCRCLNSTIPLDLMPTESAARAQDAGYHRVVV